MSKRPYSVMVDPGHGGRDPGAISNDFGYREKDINLALAQLFRRCVSKGDFLFKVYLTRNRDKFVPLNERAEKANKKGVNLFISFHCNSFSDPDVKGVEIFYDKAWEQSKVLAAEIYTYLLIIMAGHDGRGIKEADFCVLRNTNMPSVLIEFEFLSNPEQAEYLNSIENQRKLVNTLASSIEFLLEEGAHDWIL